MKKPIIILVVLLVLCGETVFAGDPECLMMYGNQELLVVAEIIEIEQEFFTLEVNHILQGECNEIIKIKAFEKYTITSEEPNLGDYCLISLNSWESVNVVIHGAYKTDTGDYKTLKTIKREDGTLEGVLTTIDWFVNSNGEYKDFSFTSSRVYLKNENGEEIQVYPKIEEEKEVEDFNSKDNSNLENSKGCSDDIDTKSNDEGNKKKEKNFILSLVIIVIGGGIIIILKKSNK